MQFLYSVNTADYPTEDWIVNPDMSAVAGFSGKYWVITGDMVSLMTPAERDAVDVADLSGSRDDIAAQLDQAQDVMVEFFKLVVTELNRKTNKINAILLAAETATSLGTFQSEMNSINDEPIRTMAQLKTALRSALDN